MTTLEQMAAEANEPKPDTPKNGPVSVKDRVAAHLAGLERQRLERRREIRQQIDQRAGLLQQLSDIESQLRTLDAKADAAAEKHRETTEPLQAKLDGAKGDVRAKLLSQLGEANISLEQSLHVLDRVRGPLKGQWTDTRNKLAALPSENRLCGDDLSSPKLRVEKFVAEKRLAMVQVRIDAAKGYLESYQPALEEAESVKVQASSHGWHRVGGPLNYDFEAIVVLRQRRDRWRAELLDAESEQHDVMKEMDEIASRMIAE
jgi:chromosome segregation ATPase